MKKILFFDIDGTLAYPRQAPSPATVDAIRQARKNGHMAFISTGRTSDSIPEAVARIGFDGGIFSAGGEIHLPHATLTHCIREDVLARILACLKRHPVFYALETADGRFHSENAREMLLQTDMTGIRGEALSLTEEILFDAAMRPMSEYRQQGVFKITYHCPKDTAPLLSAELAGIAKTVAFGDFPELPMALGEISDPTVNKGRAIQDICRYFSMSTGDCIAFGDSMNDVEMLEAAGIGVAMGNAAPQVKAQADMVCDRCECDGVAKALRELKLI